MKKKKRKFKRSFKIFVAVVVAIVALLCISRCRGGSENEGKSLPESRMPHLNDSLTNENRISMAQLRWTASLPNISSVGR